MKRKTCCIAYLCLLFYSYQAYSQAGMTASPVRNYFRVSKGNSSVKKITITNPNNTPLEIGLSVNDWRHDITGNNEVFPAGTLKTSMRNWIQVLEGSYFILQPKETRDINLVITPAADADTSIPVHTSMIYLTQLNPAEVPKANGASLKLAIRLGIKLYHSFKSFDEKNIEINEFKDLALIKDSSTNSALELKITNTGRIWLEAKTKWELMNSKTGKKVVLESPEFDMLPGEVRILRKDLPTSLEKGSYTATVIINYGNRDELKLAELDFIL